MNAMVWTLDNNKLMPGCALLFITKINVMVWTLSNNKDKSERKWMSGYEPLVITKVHLKGQMNARDEHLAITKVHLKGQMNVMLWTVINSKGTSEKTNE